MTPPSRGADRARGDAVSCSSESRGRREDRALAAPAVPRAKKVHGGSDHRFGRDSPAFPAQWFERFTPRSPRRRIPLVTVIRRLAADRTRLGRPRLRGLDTSNGCQDHTASPYAISAVRLRAGRSLTTLQESRPASPFRARRYRVHRIPTPTSVTIAIRPSCGPERAIDKADASKRPSDIFFARRLDSSEVKDVEVICPSGSHSPRALRHPEVRALARLEGWAASRGDTSFEAHLQCDALQMSTSG